MARPEKPESLAVDIGHIDHVDDAGAAGRVTQTVDLQGVRVVARRARPVFEVLAGRGCQQAVVGEGQRRRLHAAADRFQHPVAAARAGAVIEAATSACVSCASRDSNSAPGRWRRCRSHRAGCRPARSAPRRWRPAGSRPPSAAAFSSTEPRRMLPSAPWPMMWIASMPLRPRSVGDLLQAIAGLVQHDDFGAGPDLRDQLLVVLTWLSTNTISRRGASAAMATRARSAPAGVASACRAASGVAPRPAGGLRPGGMSGVGCGGHGGGVEHEALFQRQRARPAGARPPAPHPGARQAARA